MFTIVSVHLHTPVLLQLLAMEQANEQNTVSSLIGKALELYLSQPPEIRDKAACQREIIHGYQWKNVFLPEGTVLRSWSYGENNYAVVEGDQLMHAGRSVSPNQFARSFARTFRNAWMDLSIKRPQDKTYIHANRLRRETARLEKAALEAACTSALTPPPQPALPSQSHARPQVSPASNPAPTPADSAPAPTPLPATPASNASLSSQLATLLTQTVATAAQLGAANAPHNRIAQPRDGIASDEWCLPERRKFRVRLEDIDF
ncbi:hypothetical protein HSX11_28405 [Oxalobacteraceae bacterium]|nr:hypothetical protein [Oxalobacteraceae bacterium]